MAELLRKRNEAYNKQSAAAVSKTLESSIVPKDTSVLSKESLPEIHSLSLSDCKAKVQDMETGPQFPPQLIYFTQDKLSKKALNKGNQSPSIETMDADVQAEQDPQWEESYEKMKIKGITKSFKGFQKAVERCPDQCIR